MEKSVKIPEDIHEELKLLSVKKKVLLKKLVAEILREALKNEDFINKVIEKMKRNNKHTI